MKAYSHSSNIWMGAKKFIYCFNLQRQYRAMFGIAWRTTLAKYVLVNWNIIPVPSLHLDSQSEFIWLKVRYAIHFQCIQQYSMVRFQMQRRECRCTSFYSKYTQLFSAWKAGKKHFSSSSVAATIKTIIQSFLQLLLCFLSGCSQEAISMQHKWAGSR